MAMVVQHNLSATNANNKLNANVSGLKKSTEKLSSGYAINRAGDNAAGLAISEKMRSQIRGLSQATKNANDGISLIQTAEGGLNETHSILQRMRELAVQASNGTYTQEDRDAIQKEAEALKAEVDRISNATEFNGQKLLDGSLSGTGSSTTVYGPKYGSVSAQGTKMTGGKITVVSEYSGAQVVFTNKASGVGGENAVWEDDGTKVTINLAGDKVYTDAEINELIKNATLPDDATASAGSIKVSSQYGAISIGADATQDVTTTATVGGKRAQSTATDLSALVGATSGASGSSDTIQFIANSYGTAAENNGLTNVKIITDVAAGKENVNVQAAAAGGTVDPTKVELHLATGVEYSEKDIENILKQAGYDFTVKLTDSRNDPDGDTDGKIKFNVKDATGTAVTIAAGAGVGKGAVSSYGTGLTFQIGANGVEDQRVTLNIDDMDSASLGVANVDLSTDKGANAAIDMIDDAISKVSMQRAGLGALQNRLEYTVNNLTTTEENLTNAESAIRDTDMATEMISYTKFNILQQASQAMLAQANQQPQAVLQLLG